MSRNDLSGGWMGEEGGCTESEKRVRGLRGICMTFLLLNNKSSQI